jgi:L-fuconolactonase
MSSPSPLHLPVRPSWLATQTEEPLESDQIIVDAHHHLFVRPDHRYLLEDFLADLRTGHDVRATVFIQARAMYREDGPVEMRPVGETEFANRIAEAHARDGHSEVRICAGIIGYADLRLGDGVRPVLEAHIAAGGGAAHGRFRGIRHIAAWDSEPGMLNPAYPTTENMLDGEDFRQGFAHLAPLGLSYDAWLYFHQIPHLTSLARAFPETPIVLNHCGGAIGIGRFAGRRQEVFSAWSTALSELAACPNVMVKLSGLGMRLSGFGYEDLARAPSSLELTALWRPWMETCIDLFGTPRCMFASNFPVDKGSYSYAIGWNARKRIAAYATLEEKADLFWRSAVRFYRLPLP